MKDIIASKKFPSKGASSFGKAMDETAKIVMQDYGMTDLRDNQKPGDTMDPRLPSDLAKRADTAWGGTSPKAIQSGVSMAAVQSGAYAGQGDIVKQATQSIAKPKISFIE